MDPLTEASESSTILRPIGAADALEIAVILAITIAAVILVERGLPAIAARLGPRVRILVLPWVPVFRLFAFLLAALLILPIVVEPRTESLIALLGAGAVAIGFAFKDYLTSILAGVIVLFERPYRQGDWVRIGDVYGEVREMGMRALRIVTPDDDIVTVPHGRIWDSVVRNANDGSPTLQCVVDFYVHPDHDAARLRQALGDAALASPWVDVEKPIAVVVSERPWGTCYRVRAYPIAAEHQFRFASDVTVRGKGLIAELGVRPATVPVAEPVAG